MRPASPYPSSSTTRSAESGQARARYFEAVRNAARTALERSAQDIRHIRVGRNIVQLRFANSVLANELMRALTHLEIHSNQQPDLTVWIWDSQFSGVPIPRPPWKPEDYVSRGDIRGWDGDVWAAYNLGVGILSLFDTTRGEAVLWLRNPGALPEYERAAPLRTILGWFLRTRGAELVHAAAVGRSSGGVLLAGRSGRGKSTTALSCVAENQSDRSIFYAGDDYVMVERDPSPWVYSVYNSGKLDRNHAAQRLPSLLPLMTNSAAPAGEKGLLFVHEGFPERIVTGFPIRAVLIPEIEAGPGPALRPISPRAVLQELAPTTMSQMPGTGPSTLRMLAALVRAVPCYRLALGNGQSASEQIAALLADQ